MEFNPLQEEWGSVKPEELSLCASSSLLPGSLLSLGLTLLEESVGFIFGGSIKGRWGETGIFSFCQFKEE